jgi:hypothetical protein
VFVIIPIAIVLLAKVLDPAPPRSRHPELSSRLPPSALAPIPERSAALPPSTTPPPSEPLAPLLATPSFPLPDSPADPPDSPPLAQRPPPTPSSATTLPVIPSVSSPGVEPFFKRDP